MTEMAQNRTAGYAAGREPRRRLSERPLVWLVPLALLLFLTYVFPALDVVRYSFTDATLLNPEFEYTAASYRNVTGLTYGAPVFYEGFRIGQVESIEPERREGKTHYKVELSVRRDWPIPVDSVAALASSGLLAEATTCSCCNCSG